MKAANHRPDRIPSPDLSQEGYEEHSLPDSCILEGVEGNVKTMNDNPEAAYKTLER